MSATTVVIITRNRRASLSRTLERLEDLPERPPLVVVDNASEDDSVAAVRRSHGRVRIIGLSQNLGARARAVGVRASKSRYVAFCDDDSWWAPGSLPCAERHFDDYPHLALIAGRILVEPGRRLDSTCRLMAASPLSSRRPLPGPPVLGFLACGVVARREPLLALGAFEHLRGTGAEERLIALDLATAGWDLAYVPDVTAHHHPQHDYDENRRRLDIARNDLGTAWLRRPVHVALAATVRAANLRVAAHTLRRLPSLLRARRPVPGRVEDALRLLETQD